jgi:hypothetical protein
MKRTLSYTPSIIGLAITSFAATVLAATTANGPYYATPSWDQQLPASTRFIVLSNWIDASFPSGGAAVLDRETGLVWERSPTSIQSDWYSANEYCIRLTTVGGRMGWRLPTVQELYSLFDPTAVNPPTLPAGHPFTNIHSQVDTPSSGSIDYWTATFETADPFVRVVSFDTPIGFQDISRNPTGTDGYHWCVRGGINTNPQ